MSDILPSGDLTGGDSKYEAAVHATGRLEEFFRDLTTQLGTFEAELTVVEFDRDPQVMAAVRSLQELGRQSIAAVASLRDAFAQHRQASEYHKQGNDAKAEAFR